MKKPYNFQYIREAFVLPGLLLFLFLLMACSSTMPQSTASQYKFDYDGKSFRIRSFICTDRSKACNELIGKSFVATDFDQDRYIDKVSIGDLTLAQAQEIYEYGLNKLAAENKLQESKLEPINYVHQNSDYKYEIKSFQPNNSISFNQFKVMTKNQLADDVIAILIDYKADGTLDEVLKGNVDTGKFQSIYAEVLKTGLEKQKLITVNDMIIVREN